MCIRKKVELFNSYHTFYIHFTCVVKIDTNSIVSCFHFFLSDFPYLHGLVFKGVQLFTHHLTHSPETVSTALSVLIHAAPGACLISSFPARQHFFQEEGEKDLSMFLPTKSILKNSISFVFPIKIPKWTLCLETRNTPQSLSHFQKELFQIDKQNFPFNLEFQQSSRANSTYFFKSSFVKLIFFIIQRLLIYLIAGSQKVALKIF